VKQKDFDKMLKHAGLSKIRFHDLRHNAASNMIAKGLSIVQISRYLGHSSPRITLEIYAHLIPGDFEEISRSHGISQWVKISQFFGMLNKENCTGPKK
jgi:integrase